jgi:hypothetical protein
MFRLRRGYTRGNAKPQGKDKSLTKMTTSGPLLGVSSGFRRVILDENWCGVVRKDYAALEESTTTGSVRLSD